MELKLPEGWALVSPRRGGGRNSLQIFFKTTVWHLESGASHRLFPDEPESDRYRGSYRVVQTAHLRAQAPSLGRRVPILSVGLTHTNSSDETMPRGDKGIALKKMCVHSTLDHLFKAMTLAHTQGLWILGGDFNLEQKPMEFALRDYEGPADWDQTVMALPLGDRLNPSGGVWLISSNSVVDVATDGRRGYDTQHKIVVTEVSVDQQALGDTKICPSTQAGPRLKHKHFLLLPHKLNFLCAEHQHIRGAIM